MPSLLIDRTDGKCTHANNAKGVIELIYLPIKARLDCAELYVVDSYTEKGEFVLPVDVAEEIYNA